MISTKKEKKQRLIYKKKKKPIYIIHQNLKQDCAWW